MNETGVMGGINVLIVPRISFIVQYFEINLIKIPIQKHCYPISPLAIFDKFHTQRSESCDVHICMCKLLIIVFIIIVYKNSMIMEAMTI